MVQFIVHGLISVFLCVLIFAGSKSCQFGDGLLCGTESPVSWTTAVIHSKEGGVDMAHETIQPKSHSQFSQMMMGQYRLGKTKLKQAIRLTWNAFKKLLHNFIVLNGILLLFDWLPDASRQLKMAKATSLIFFTARHPFSPRGGCTICIMGLYLS